MDESRARSVLEVAPSASEDAIEEAFQEKVKQYHPDVSDAPDSTEKFLQVKKARKTLTRAATTSARQSTQASATKQTTHSKQTTQDRTSEEGWRTEKTERTNTTTSTSGSSSQGRTTSTHSHRDSSQTVSQQPPSDWRSGFTSIYKSFKQTLLWLDQNLVSSLTTLWANLTLEFVLGVIFKQFRYRTASDVAPLEEPLVQFKAINQLFYLRLKSVAVNAVTQTGAVSVVFGILPVLIYDVVIAPVTLEAASIAIMGSTIGYLVLVHSVETPDRLRNKWTAPKHLYRAGTNYWSLLASILGVGAAWTVGYIVDYTPELFLGSLATFVILFAYAVPIAALLNVVRDRLKQGSTTLPQSNPPVVISDIVAGMVAVSVLVHTPVAIEFAPGVLLGGSPGALGDGAIKWWAILYSIFSIGWLGALIGLADVLEIGWYRVFVDYSTPQARILWGGSVSSGVGIVIWAAAPLTTTEIALHQIVEYALLYCGCILFLYGVVTDPNG